MRTNIKFFLILLIVFFGYYFIFHFNAHAYIVGKDDRVSIQKYRNTYKLTYEYFHALFGAVGKIECKKKWWGTGFLVDRNDIVVSVGHMVRKIGNSTLIEPKNQAEFISECTFRPILGKQKYRFSQKYIAPKRISDLSTRPHRNDDWLVVRLRRPVDGVIPYKLDENDNSSRQKGIMRPGRKGILIGAFAANGWLKRPVVFECGIKGYGGSGAVRSELNPVYMTDCDVGQGTSGGPFIVWQERKSSKSQEQKLKSNFFVAGILSGTSTKKKSQGASFPKAYSLITSIGKSAREAIKEIQE